MSDSLRLHGLLTSRLLCSWDFPGKNAGVESSIERFKSLFLKIALNIFEDSYHASGGFPGNSAGKETACNAGDSGLIPRLGRSAGEGIGYPLEYSGLPW